MTRKILLLISDTHAGSLLALMPPDVVLIDETPEGNEVEYTPQQTAWQKRYWKLYTDSIEALKKFANDDEIMVIHNGDLTDGDKYPHRLVSTRKADQMIIASENLRRLAELSNVTSMRIVAGTEAHNFGENTAEILVSKNLQSKFSDKNISFVRHGLLTYNGLTIDYAHHGPGAGSRNWLKGNVARYYLQSLMRDELDHGKEPPKLVTRGHVHEFVSEKVRIGNHISNIIITPSYSAIGDHANQVARSPGYITNGMEAIEVIDGEICRTKEMHLTTDVRRKETI